MSVRSGLIAGAMGIANENDEKEKKGGSKRPVSRLHPLLLNQQARPEVWLRLHPS